MNIFTYLWKRVLFKKYYWRPEEIDRMEKKAEEFMKAFNIEENQQ